MAEVTTLRTERTVLRPWREGDREAFAAMNADPLVMEHFPGVLTQDESDSFAATITAGLAARGWGLWALEIPGELAFAGFVGLNPVRFELPAALAELPPVEIGWRLAAAAWGWGYASEAATAVLDAAFGPIGRTEIVSFTTPANRRSRRVMEKIGLHHAPEDDFDHPAMIERGFPELVRHVLYRTTAAENAARRRT